MFYQPTASFDSVFNTDKPKTSNSPRYRTVAILLIYLLQITWSKVAQKFRKLSLHISIQYPMKIRYCCSQVRMAAILVVLNVELKMKERWWDLKSKMFVLSYSNIRQAVQNLLQETHTPRVEDTSLCSLLV